MELIIGILALFLVIYIVLLVTKRVAFSLISSVPGIIILIIVILLFTQLWMTRLRLNS